jgi:hypothetical protein
MPLRKPSILIIGWVLVWAAGLCGLGDKAMAAPPEQDLTHRSKAFSLPAAIEAA